MQIYVSKNSQQVGPYSTAEARNRILLGEFTGADLAWHPGLPAWVTLSEILASQPAHPTLGAVASESPAPTPLSGFAIASLAASIIGAIGWIILLICGIIAHHQGRTKDEQDPMMLVIGLGIIGGMILNIFGAIGGIVALVKGSSHKWMPITGLIFNVLEFLLVFGLMILGLLAK